MVFCVEATGVQGTIVWTKVLSQPDHYHAGTEVWMHLHLRDALNEFIY